MKTKYFQKLMLILGFVSAILAGTLSFRSESITSEGDLVSEKRGGKSFGAGTGAGIDIAADGGAMGFAVLAGLCFIAFSITTLKKDRE